MKRMSSRLLTEWIAYNQIEPFGDELLDIQLARLAAIQVSTKKNPVDLGKFRLWKKIVNFDPQEYFDQLKDALTFKKWDE